VQTPPPSIRALRAETIERFTGIVEVGLRDAVGGERVGAFAAGTLVGGVHELLRARIESGELKPAAKLAREIAASQLVPLKAA
jgi:hypothetical protein